MEHKLGETFDFKSYNISIEKALSYFSCQGCMYDDGHNNCNKPFGFEGCISEDREDKLDIIFIKQQ